MLKPTTRCASGQSLDDRACSTVAARLAKIHTLQDELTSSAHSHDVLELALATAISPAVPNRDTTAPIWLLIVGVPSSDKTATVLLLRGSPATYHLDTFTPGSFASGFVDPNPGAKKKREDLLPQLNGKCLIVKDMTTLFSGRPDKVADTLGNLLAIYDGEYAKATGTLDVIRYKSQFAWLGCITPQVLAQHHNYMSRIGSRFLYYRIPSLTEEELTDGFGVIWDDTSHQRECREELQKLVLAHVAEVNSARLVVSPATSDQQGFIKRLAMFVACGRATICWRESGGKYEITDVQREEPWRAAKQLVNLGHALARIHGRGALTDHELGLLRRVVLSSLPSDRKEVLELFHAHPEGLTVKMCAEGIRKSDNLARGRLQELGQIGVAVEEELSTGGRPATLYFIAPPFADIVSKGVEPLDHLLDLASSGLSTQKSPQGMEEPVEKSVEVVRASGKFCVESLYLTEEEDIWGQLD